MKSFINKMLLCCLIFGSFSSCEKYQLCTETPEIDMLMAFRIVDENGEDLGYNKTFTFPIIELLNKNGEDIIRYYAENDETQQGFFYIENFGNLSVFNSDDYVLKYSFSLRDTVSINAEWLTNPCDFEYSKINSITRGTTAFEQVDNVFIIVKE